MSGPTRSRAHPGQSAAAVALVTAIFVLSTVPLAGAVAGGGTSVGGADPAAVSATGPPAVSATRPPAVSQTDPPAVSATVTYGRLPDEPRTVAVTFELDVDESVEELVVAVRTSGSVVQRRGMTVEADASGDGVRVTWDGETDAPSFTYHAAGDRTGDGWTFASVDHAVRYRDDGGWHGTDVGRHRHDPGNGIELRRRTAGSGYVGSSVQYLGEYTATSRTLGNHTVTLVVPDGADLTADRETILDGLAAASGQLAVGDRDAQVNVFVRHGGTFGRTYPEEHGVQDLSLPASTPYGYGASNTWLHEYVHARQQFVVEDPRVRWFVEASAEYYELLLSHGLDEASFQAFYDAVSTDSGASVVLSDPSAGGWEIATYRKGARVLAALDAKIRRASGGDRSLQYVFRRMNHHGAEEDDPPAPVTYEAFRDIVAEAAGEPLDDWLDRYVTTEAVPEVPREPDLYATTGASGAVPDGDPTATGTERRTTSSSDDRSSPDGTSTSSRSTEPATTDAVATTSPGGSSAVTGTGLGVLSALGALAVLVANAARRRDD